jgi:hypothetical protein
MDASKVVALPTMPEIDAPEGAAYDSLFCASRTGYYNGMVKC